MNENLLAGKLVSADPIRAVNVRDHAAALTWLIVAAHFGVDQALP